jgi:hypothetical protein
MHNIGSSLNAVQGRLLCAKLDALRLDCHGEPPFLLSPVYGECTYTARANVYGTEPALRWTRQMVRDTVLDQVLSNPAVRKIRADVERQVKAGELTPALAAQQILKAASI